jgi:hypothetical protein
MDKTHLGGGHPKWWSRDVKTLQATFDTVLKGRLVPALAAKAAAAADRAAECHRDQQRSNGEPYLVHPIRVALSAMLEFDRTDVDFIVAALLHDVLEDAGVTSESISESFGEAVARLVSALTRTTEGHRLADKRQDPYVQGLVAAGPDAILLKLLDKLDNLRDSLSHADAEKQRKWTSETYMVYLLLAQTLPEENVRAHIKALLQSALELHDRKVYTPDLCRRHYTQQFKQQFEPMPSGSAIPYDLLAADIFNTQEMLGRFLLFNPSLTFWLVNDGVQVVKLALAPPELASTVASSLAARIDNGHWPFLAGLASLSVAFGDSDRARLWRAIRPQLDRMARLLGRTPLPAWLQGLIGHPPHLLCAIHSRLLLPAFISFPTWHDTQGLLAAQVDNAYRSVLDGQQAERWQQQLRLGLQCRNALWRRWRGVGSVRRALQVLEAIRTLAVSSGEEPAKLLAFRLLCEYVDVTSEAGASLDAADLAFDRIWAALSPPLLASPSCIRSASMPTEQDLAAPLGRDERIDFVGLHEVRRLSCEHRADLAFDKLVEVLLEEAGKSEAASIWIAFDDKEIAKRSRVFFDAIQWVAAGTRFEELKLAGIEVNKDYDPITDQCVLTVQPAQRLAIMDRLPEAQEDLPRLQGNFQAASMFDVLIGQKLEAGAGPLWIPRVYRVLDTISDFDPANVQRIDVSFDPTSDARPFTTYLPLPDTEPTPGQMERQRKRKRIVALYVLVTIYNQSVILGARGAIVACGKVDQRQREFAFAAGELQRMLDELVRSHHFDKYANYLQIYNFEPFAVRVDDIVDRNVDFGTRDMEFGKFLGIDIGGSFIKASLFDAKGSHAVGALVTIPPEYDQAGKKMPVADFFDRLLSHLDDQTKGGIRWHALDGIGISWPGAVRESRLAATSATLTKLQFGDQGNPLVLGYAAPAEQICAADFVGAFVRQLQVRGKRLRDDAAIILENDGNAEAYGNYCMLARAGIIKTGSKVIIKLGTSLAGGDVTEHGAVSSHVTEFAKAILDFGECHAGESAQWPQGSARDFVSSVGVRNLSRRFRFPEEVVFGDLGGLNASDALPARIESVELGELLDLWRLVDSDPLETNRFLRELVESENRNSGPRCAELHARIVQAACIRKSDFQARLIAYIRSRGTEARRREKAAAASASQPPDAVVWQLGLERLGLLLGQPGLQCTPMQLGLRIDAVKLAAKVLGAVALFSELALAIAHYVVLLYNIYNSDRMKEIILSGGVLKGVTGSLVRRQAEGFLLKWYNKVYGPARRLQPGCIVLAHVEGDRIVPVDGLVGPYGAAMVANRAHKAAAWRILNEHVEFLVGRLEPGNVISAVEIRRQLGRTRFELGDVRQCLDRMVSAARLLPDARDVDKFVCPWRR